MKRKCTACKMRKYKDKDHFCPSGCNYCGGLKDLRQANLFLHENGQHLWLQYLICENCIHNISITKPIKKVKIKLVG